MTGLDRLDSFSMLLHCYCAIKDDMRDIDELDGRVIWHDAENLAGRQVAATVLPLSHLEDPMGAGELFTILAQKTHHQMRLFGGWHGLTHPRCILMTIHEALLPKPTIIIEIKIESDDERQLRYLRKFVEYVRKNSAQSLSEDEIGLISAGYDELIGHEGTDDQPDSSDYDDDKRTAFVALYQDRASDDKKYNWTIHRMRFDIPDGTSNRWRSTFSEKAKLYRVIAALYI